RGAVYRQRRGVAWNGGHRSGRRDVFGGSLLRAGNRLAACEGNRWHRPEGHADAQRHDQVLSSYLSPLAGRGAPHTFPSARKIFPGVNGMSVSGFAPNGRSASLIAFMMQAGAPAVPASPAPFAPNSESAVGETTWPQSMSGISAAIGTR